MGDEEKQSEIRKYYALKFISVPVDKKIACLREIRNIKNCNLKTGKNIIETPNSVVAYTEDKTIAESWKQVLKKIGATVELEEIQSDKLLSELNESLVIEENTEQENFNFDITTIFDMNFREILFTPKTILLLVMLGIAIYLHSVSKPHTIDFVLLFGLFIYRCFTCLRPNQKDNIIKFIFNLILFILAWSLMGLDYPSSIQYGLWAYFGLFTPILDSYLYIERKFSLGDTINGIVYFFLFVSFIVILGEMSTPENFTPEGRARLEAIEKQEALEKERQAQEDALKTAAGIAFRALSKQYTSEAMLQLYGIASTGNSLVLQVNVEIRNEGKSPYKLNKIGAILVDNNGAKYDGATLTNALDMLNASQNILNPGMSTTKMLFFKIPEEKDYTLKLYDGNIFSDPVIIKL